MGIYPEYDGPVEVSHPAEGVTMIRRAAEPPACEPDADCPGHYDDDAALTSGASIGEPIYCGGTCTPAKIRRADESAAPAPVVIPEDDEYGLALDDGWEDPAVHDDCTGCDMCREWEGMNYDVIRGRRKAYVSTVRLRGHL